MNLINICKYSVILLPSFVMPKTADSQTINEISEAYKAKQFSQVRLQNISSFEFTNEAGTTVSLSKFLGKFLIIDVWYTGCGACILANQGLRIVHDSLKNENIVFLSISVDKDKSVWRQSVAKDAKKTKINPWAGKYHPADGTVVLYTGGTGEDNEFIKTFVPNRTYPQLLFVNRNGEIISSCPPRPDYVPSTLINYIKQYL